jgi:signal transduction histidine kinase
VEGHGGTISVQSEIGKGTTPPFPKFKIKKNSISIEKKNYFFKINGRHLK